MCACMCISTLTPAGALQGVYVIECVLLQTGTCSCEHEKVDGHGCVGCGLKNVPGSVHVAGGYICSAHEDAQRERD